MGPAFETDFDPRYGELVDVSPSLRRLVARNPSKYTFRGTGTYVVGRGTVAVVDPGPDDQEHLEALAGGLARETISHILVTHTHADHSPGARRLSEVSGAPVLAYGPHPPGAVGEGDHDHADRGVDAGFEPHDRLEHGDVITGPGWTIETVHTPGHMSNHLCFALREERALLTGDHVMGWSTTVIPPPDGDLRAYLDSLELVLERGDEILYPTHGGPRHDPARYVADLLRHRLEREAQILAQLDLGPRPVAEIVSVLYADVREELHAPAARSVLAHLIKLRGEELVTSDGADDEVASWRLASRRAP